MRCTSRRAMTLMLVGAAASALFRPGSAGADILKADAAKDNTLYFDGFGSVSNGAGQHFFSGMTQHFSRRRALIEFDVSAIPAGSTVTSVTLRLNMSRTVASTQTLGLHRVLQEWGEGPSVAIGEEGSGGASMPPDATWVHAIMPSVFWATEGGDYAPTASASLPVGNVGFYTWGSTTGMAADVQGWVDDASTNHGWLILGNELSLRTAKRFDSRENEVEGNRPVLTVEYTPPAGCPIDYVPDGTIDFLDYLEFLNLYDAQDPLADLTGDGTVDFSDYLEFLNYFDGGC